ncbi:cysteine hydrolase family protein [Bacillus sp. RAR_GA_16]|uniref:cysteine hydrolase family protein n=1 Tax=Bacillus sp. RAR_GA_16 TaxID=2876774 RepID=UPI001CD026E8|nr:isochorismatase family cysteine hydrolase [Bacillus sp. RAR_GA_16]MCA0170971.1 cysteine hydrolase [Bacillus sp. RAR_GA_16]
MANEALLIIDMSNDFIHDEGGLTSGKVGQEIVPNIITLANEFLQEGKEVIICMDAHEENDEHFAIWPVHNVIGTWGQELYGELNTWFEENKNHSHVTYVAKPEYDAFYNTNLEEILHSKKVDIVHLSGVCTDICDFLTAYGAYARGFHTVAHRSGMATFTEHHEVFLQQMKNIFKTEIR